MTKFFPNLKKEDYPTLYLCPVIKAASLKFNDINFISLLKHI